MNLSIPEIIAELTRLNTRTEKHGDEEVLANDLSISVILPAQETLKQLCVGESQKLVEAFWTEDGKAREPTIAAIKLNHSLKDHRLKISVGIEEAITFEETKLDGFSWTPQNGHTLKLKFKAKTVTDEQELAYIAGGLGKHIQIAIEPPLQMDISEMKAPEETQAEDKPARKRRRAAA
jgi:hypothetical protein